MYCDIFARRHLCCARMRHTYAPNNGTTRTASFISSLCSSVIFDAFPPEFDTPPTISPRLFMPDCCCCDCWFPRPAVLKPNPPPPPPPRSGNLPCKVFENGRVGKDCDAEAIEWLFAIGEEFRNARIMLQWARRCQQ